MVGSTKKIRSRFVPLLKYPGGKEKELKFILPNMPDSFQDYYEPFVGGGAVYFSVHARHYFINDLSKELMTLYDMVSTNNQEFFDRIETINRDWKLMRTVVDGHSRYLISLYLDFKANKINDITLDDLLFHFVQKNNIEFNGLLLPDFNIDIQNFVKELIKSLRNKFRRIKNNEKKFGDLSNDDLLLNIECGFKSAFYMHFRHLYNNIEKLEISKSFYAAIYFFIREYCYSSMFRFNNDGFFNVPYGGISYNKKTLTKKIEHFKNKELIFRLGNTTRINEDFEKFIQDYPPNVDDFIFLDPPYDTEFSTYDQNEFGKKDQQRLANYLINICQANFMLVIKNTDFICNLYPLGKRTANSKHIRIIAFNKNYQVSFQNRNDKEAEHLIIMNY